MPAYVQALLEQTAESLENLQRIMQRAEEGRSSANTSVSMLAERLSGLTEFMLHVLQLLVRLADNSVELRTTLGMLSYVSSQGVGFGMDEASRGHIRNIELYMARMLEELVTGRTAIADELRGEIKLLARTLAARQIDRAS